MTPEDVMILVGLAGVAAAGAVSVLGGRGEDAPRPIPVRVEDDARRGQDRGRHSERNDRNRG